MTSGRILKLIRRPRIRQMRSREWKDAMAQKWREGSCRVLFRVSTSGQTVRAGKILFSAIALHELSACPGQPLRNPLILREKLAALPRREWQRDCSDWFEPCPFVYPPAAPGSGSPPLPDRLTELVPSGILLLQTAAVSIHLRATRPSPVKTQALRIFGAIWGSGNLPGSRF